ncbi:hypothetical protein E3N88_04079 [Mikania micrantha]|uniref:O-methyltransferase domain-containing protein n=1 Tax=Mikania micrantha TaxID=192012 RepID=A0A5N6PVJ0_9ASTR|nr:hypothetical protein E3N88_04079 [Mikania micrantha]
MAISNCHSHIKVEGNKKVEMAMQAGDDEQSRCLLQSQAHIWSHIFSFINSMTLKCAIELQIPDIINRHGTPMLLSELVEALSISKEKSNFVYRSAYAHACSLWFLRETKWIDSIVDVGGGIGNLAKSISEAFPNISCISFDLPHVVKGLDGNKNLTYVGGDMFEAIPKASAVMMKAIPSKDDGGKLIIIDMVVINDEPDNKTLETQLRYDMLMMTILAGKERTEKEWAKLFSDAGFSNYKITPVLGLRMVGRGRGRHMGGGRRPNTRSNTNAPPIHGNEIPHQVENTEAAQNEL